MPNFVVEFFEGLGLPRALVDVLVLPLLAALVIWVLRLVFLRAIKKRFRRPQDLRRWRRISVYVALVAAGLIFWQIWLTSLRQVALLVAALTELEASTTLDWLNSTLAVFFSTVALILVISILRAIRRALMVRLRAWSIFAKSVRFQRLDVLTPARVRDGVSGVIRALYFLFLWTAVGLYTLTILEAYPGTARFSGGLLRYFAAAALDIGTAFVDYLPNLVYLVVIFFVARYSLKLMRFLLEATGRGDLSFPGFDREWAEPTYKLGRVVLILFTVMVSYPYLPAAQSDLFQGFSIFLGALVTLGSTAIIGNVISGIVLTYTGSFRIGDRVRIGSITGNVLEKTLFVTRMRTVENEIVSIPNGIVLTGSVTNYARLAKDKSLILTVRVGIGYDVPRTKVHELLLAAAAKTEGIVPNPPTAVWQISLDDYAVTYELRAATDRPARMAVVRSDLNGHVLDAFNEAGIEVMTPDVQNLRDGSSPAIPAEYDPPAGPVAKLRVDLKNAADALRSNKQP